MLMIMSRGDGDMVVNSSPTPTPPPLPGEKSAVPPAKPRSQDSWVLGCIQQRSHALPTAATSGCSDGSLCPGSDRTVGVTVSQLLEGS